MNILFRLIAMEWRKQRGSLAGWMILAAACFTPAAVLLVRMLQQDALPRLYASPEFWRGYWNSASESVVVFLLPMCVILVTALLAQLEHRNGTWKQVSGLPVSQTSIFPAKLAIAALLVAQFLLLFVAAGTLGALLPAWLLEEVPFPADVSYALPFKEAARYFVLILPMLVAQFSLSLRFSNFLVPLAAGFMAWIAALALLSWKYAQFVPYGHAIQYYMALQPNPKVRVDLAQLSESSLIATLVFAVLGLIVFLRRPVKG